MDSLNASCTPLTDHVAVSTSYPRIPLISTSSSSSLSIRSSSSISTLFASNLSGALSGSKMVPSTSTYWPSVMPAEGISAPAATSTVSVDPFLKISRNWLAPSYWSTVPLTSKSSSNASCFSMYEASSTSPLYSPLTSTLSPSPIVSKLNPGSSSPSKFVLFRSACTKTPITSNVLTFMSLGSVARLLTGPSTSSSYDTEFAVPVLPSGSTEPWILTTIPTANASSPEATSSSTS